MGQWRFQQSRNYLVSDLQDVIRETAALELFKKYRFFIFSGFPRGGKQKKTYFKEGGGGRKLYWSRSRDREKGNGTPVVNTTLGRTGSRPWSTNEVGKERKDL
jgi:hypothetical protein